MRSAQSHLRSIADFIARAVLLLAHHGRLFAPRSASASAAALTAGLVQEVLFREPAVAPFVFFPA